MYHINAYVCVCDSHMFSVIHVWGLLFVTIVYNHNASGELGEYFCRYRLQEAGCITIHVL